MRVLNGRNATRTRILACAIAGLVALAPRAASAQSPPSDKAAAEALFDEARALMKEAKYDVACPKLAESQRLDPGIGTLLYLASCHEKSGRVATAWVTFREAAAAAHRVGQLDREKIATARADALAPSVPRLTISPDAAAGEPEITRDGVPVTRTLWGTPLPVDPGAHVIEVRLVGHKSRSITVTVPQGETLNLPIEPLEREAPAPASVAPASIAPRLAAEPDSPSEAPPTFRRAAPFVAGGIGVAGVIVGTIFGLRAFSLASNVEDSCPSGPCSASDVARARDSETAGNISTVAFVIGAAGVAVATVLWLTAPSRPRGAVSRVTLTPRATFTF